MKKSIIILLVVLSIVLAACSGEPNSVESDRKQTENNQSQYVKQVPVPSFAFPLARFIFAELYKIQNEKISTFSYVYSDFQGKIVWSCPSISYVFPGGTQLTNPEQIADSYQGGYAIIPQAEPNGLYSAPTSQGTWVACVWTDGTVYMHYEERQVSVDPFPMTTVDGVVVPMQDVAPSRTIDIDK